MATAANGGWGDFRADLLRRTTKPLRHVTFVMYFLASVVAIGGLGLWVELINYARAPGTGDLTAVRTAIATFFPALIGSTCLQIILGDYLKQLRAFAFLFTLAFAAVAFWLIVDKGLAAQSAVGLGAAASVASLWFWCIANADNADLFDEELKPTAATGGEDTNRDLGGDLNGFDA